MGFYLSAPGIITFKKGAELRDIFATLPHERILLETDAPYLAPVPYRGRPNEPAFMVETAKVLAETWQLSLTEVAKITSENTRRFFNLPAV
jgi:TatD DNase family protein